MSAFRLLPFAFCYPNFSFTKVNIAVAMLTTMNVAIARQTASDSVNFQIARMHRTVQATSDTVITTNAIIMIGPKIMPYQGGPEEPSHHPYIMALLQIGDKNLLF